jgi:polyhydroxybutyrate depolymerase
MRPRSLAAATALAAVLAGCGGDPEPADSPEIRTGLQELTLAGSERTFLLYVPARYDPDTPAPLVLVLHGRPGTAYGIAGTSGMSEVAEQAGFLVAYPDNMSDIGRLRDLLGQVTGDLNVAPDQIYATGFSAGGTMSWQLAGTSGVHVAAVASVLGPYNGGADEAASTASALQIVGLADRGWLWRIDDGLVAWRERQGCAESEPTFLDEDERVGQTINDCVDGTELVEYRVEGLTHLWPATLEPGTPTSQTIWEFFAAHRSVG